MDPITIRREKPQDAAEIRHVNERAFGADEEAKLVDRLRKSGAFMLSLVAIFEDRVVGHILFTPVTIEHEDKKHIAVGLGPMAVLPEEQRKGIGTNLVKEGLHQLQREGNEIVIVLGHPDYYPRFGFLPAKRFGISCEFDAPDDVFMVLELRKNSLERIHGTVKYQPEFNEA